MAKRTRSKPSRGSFLVGAGFLVGWLGGGLLFLEDQCARLEAQILGDFKAVVFFEEDLPEDRRAILEERLRASPGVAAVRFVPREEAWQRLKRVDGDLAREVSFLGENPLPDSFDLSVEDSALMNPGLLVGDLEALEAVASVRVPWKQVEGFQRVRFYHRFIELCLGGAAFVLLVAGGWGLWRSSLVQAASGGALALCLAGGVLGTTLIHVSTLPSFFPLPVSQGLSLGSHFAVWAFVVLVGWMIVVRWSEPQRRGR